MCQLQAQLSMLVSRLRTVSKHFSREANVQTEYAAQSLQSGPVPWFVGCSKSDLGSPAQGSEKGETGGVYQTDNSTRHAPPNPLSFMLTRPCAPSMDVGYPLGCRIKGIS